MTPAPKSDLPDIDKNLLIEFFVWRDQAIPINVARMKFEACYLSLRFCEKNESAQISSIRIFITRQGFVWQFGTHTAEHDLKETFRLARLRQDLDTIVMFWYAYFSFLINCVFLFFQCRWIINMDQTPSYFLMHPKKMLDSKGKKSMHVLSSTDDASGDKLSLFVIFNQIENGCITKMELHIYQEGPIYVCQENDWMDCIVMLRWVDSVLKPDTSNTPPDVRPIVYLDSYCCHMLHHVLFVRLENWTLKFNTFLLDVRSTVNLLMLDSTNNSKAAFVAFGMIGLLNLGEKKLQSSHLCKKIWQNRLFVIMIVFLIQL